MLTPKPMLNANISNGKANKKSYFVFIITFSNQFRLYHDSVSCLAEYFYVVTSKADNPKLLIHHKNNRDCSLTNKCLFQHQ
jgi:hypothetical protein